VIGPGNRGKARRFMEGHFSEAGIPRSRAPAEAWTLPPLGEDLRS
jgi:hypothetical protein